ncbi:FadR/GntR family transcriptional regulator [Paenibacillus tyrfis]|uniref:FadR/GntR family transcriptional regulator n=1 Tax=Paenibacillus tyrfis TaxID=1501230 RepID=UPI00209E3430|nr:FadR/GntR family transcriptional regulator [Paenibacillus tyrfis]MCP1312422.1 FadR family transcriptional regulator [Paenibacillus tyrfis]
MTEDRQFTTVPRRKLVDEVLEQLQKKISSAQYKPGDMLPTEPELMKQFGVGRSTVREAVKTLVHAGLLEVKQGYGTYVRSQSPRTNHFGITINENNRHHIYEVRKMLELQICALAAERRTEANLRKIRAHLDKRNRVLETGNYADYVDEDISFHISIAEATQNELMVDLYRSFCDALRELLSTLILDVQHYEDNTIIHEKLYEAIANQDVATAQMLTLENLTGNLKLR